VVGRIADGILSLITATISFILMMTRPDRLCLPDLVAGTVVPHDPNAVLSLAGTAYAGAGITAPALLSSSARRQRGGAMAEAEGIAGAATAAIRLSRVAREEVPVMTGPGDPRAAAGGSGHLRASHADREQVIEVLKNAYVRGRLTKPELDARVGQAFASRTLAELATVTADIPAEPVAPTSRQAVRTRQGVLVIAASTLIITAGLWAVAVASDSAALGLLSWAFAFTCLGIVFLVGGAMLDARYRKALFRSRGRRAAGQLP
jgi:Domain of unknown function (DUF1707)